MTKHVQNRVSSGLGKKTGLFGGTDWGVLKSLREATGSEGQPLLEVLAKKYWTPLFQYLLIQGYDQFEAQDLVQDFFAFAMKTRLFSKADQQRGRFRSFLLGSLNHFLSNQRRTNSAKKRRPEGGFASVEELAEFGYYQPKAFANRETPEMIFHRAWLREVVRNVLQILERDFRKSGKVTHYALFVSRVVAPELEGEEPPPLETQARELGLKYKEAANQVLTAKRAFLRILQKEVQGYTAPEESSEETKNVLELFKVEA